MANGTTDETDTDSDNIPDRIDPDVDGDNIPNGEDPDYSDDDPGTGHGSSGGMVVVVPGLNIVPGL